MTDTHATDELRWTASRYVWGELPPAEQAAFEERLTHDEAACLAVADAVKLTALIQAGGRRALTTQPMPSSVTVPRSRWSAALVAVAVSAVAACWFAVRQAASPAVVNPVSSELLARWTDAGQREDAELWDEFDAEPEVLDESLSAPSWMLHAVQLSTKPSQP